MLLLEVKNLKGSIGYLPQYYNYPPEQTVEEFMTEETYNYDNNSSK